MEKLVHIVTIIFLIFMETIVTIEYHMHAHIWLVSL